MKILCLGRPANPIIRLWRTYCLGQVTAYGISYLINMGSTLMPGPMVDETLMVFT